MNRCFYCTIVCVVTALFAISLAAAGAQRPIVPSDAQANPVRPRQPGGLLGDSLGTYITIEGVLYDGFQEKVESNTLLVDTVDGKKLAEPIQVLIRNVRPVPAKTRCVFKGYELGEMIGTPPAVRDATEELGQKYVEQSSALWRWRPYFVVLIAVEPGAFQLSRRKLV